MTKKRRLSRLRQRQRDVTLTRSRFAAEVKTASDDLGWSLFWLAWLILMSIMI